MTALFIRLVILTVSLFASACAARATSTNAAAQYAEAARNDPRGKPYVIGVADVIHISVWKNESLSTDAIVRPDGTITIPVVGELLASGRTAIQLQDDAARRLKTILNESEAVVTVSVVEINSYRFSVAGNVERPGLFTARYYVTVSEAIALAGGPNRYASTDEIEIVRTNGRAQRIPIDYDAILSGKSPEQDIVILAGDAVRVP